LEDTGIVKAGTFVENLYMELEANLAEIIEAVASSNIKLLTQLSKYLPHTVPMSYARVIP
jgi:hypothetical protein